MKECISLWKEGAFRNVVNINELRAIVENEISQWLLCLQCEGEAEIVEKFEKDCGDFLWKNMLPFIRITELYREGMFQRNYIAKRGVCRKWKIK